MLGENDVYTMLPVDDIEKAKKFYRGTLGLEEDPNANGVFYKSGNTKVMVYESKYAGTNKGTAANWDVDNIDKIAKDLESKGVKFEHYEFGGVEHEGPIHIMGNIRAMWFKDPAGNILGVTSVSR
jgi:catechol 2,3-dioxygenase-like lactoylglutathione lyase family enzyme